MQSAEREFGLRFHPGAPEQHDVSSSGAQIVKQRRLPDAGLAPKYQRRGYGQNGRRTAAD